MSLESDDLEDCINKFRNILYKQDDYKINETDMWSLIENLTNELELSKENEACLRKNLEKCLDSEHGDITTKFVYLREKCKEFEEETVNLRGCVEDLQIQIVTDAEMLKNDCLRKCSEVEETYKREISMLKEKMENERKYHEAKEKGLLDELQLAQAATDLRCDEIESDLKRQLVDSNNKLRQSQNVIRSLQTDINRLKNQLSLANQQASYRKQSKPEIRFQPLPITSRKTTVNYQETESDDLEYFEVPPPKNFPISNRSDTPPVPPHRDFTRESNTPIVFKGDNRNLNKVRRKRKLYDPDTFDESNIPQFS